MVDCREAFGQSTSFCQKRYLRSLSFLPLLFALLLAACAGLPTTGSSEQPRAPAPTASTTLTPAPAIPAPPSPASTGKRGGGYYKDDGPGDNPPANLADIPDAQPKAEALNRYANRPYVALGQSYTPRQEIAPFVERGLASWYGKRFHGVRTSSGETYDMYAMTAAHPTLPIPSYARVTNLENGRSVIVRINDRGPFHKDRVMDLSYTAAWKLGYVDKGSAMVEVEAIVPGEVTMVASSAPPARSADITSVDAIAAPPDPIALAALPPDLQALASTADDTPAASVATPDVLPHGIFLQLGAFNSSRNAESFRDYVQTELKWLKQGLAIIPDGDKFRLHAGPFDTLQGAREAAERISKAIKLKPFVVQR